MTLADRPLALRNVKSFTEAPSGSLPNSVSSRRSRAAPRVGFGATTQNIRRKRRADLKACMAGFWRKLGRRQWETRRWGAVELSTGGIRRRRLLHAVLAVHVKVVGHLEQRHGVHFEFQVNGVRLRQARHAAGFGVLAVGSRVASVKLLSL